MALRQKGIHNLKKPSLDGRKVVRDEPAFEPRRCAARGHDRPEDDSFTSRVLVEAPTLEHFYCDTGEPPVSTASLNSTWTQFAHRQELPCVANGERDNRWLQLELRVGLGKVESTDKTSPKCGDVEETGTREYCLRTFEEMKKNQDFRCRTRTPR